MKIIVSIFLFFLLLSPLHSVEISLDNSANSNAYGAITLLTNNVSNTYYNPSYAKNQIETSLTYLFSMKDLAFYNLYIGKTFSHYALVNGLSFLNNQAYKRGEYTLSLSKKLLGITMGLSANVIFIKIADSPMNASYYLSYGFHKHFKRFSLAFSCKNITASKFDGEKLPIVLFWETSYKPTKKSNIAFGIEKQTDYDFIYKLATYYKITDAFSLYSGYRLNPQRVGFGFDLSIKKIDISYSILTHTYLNLTHYITIRYEI